MTFFPPTIATSELVLYVAVCVEAALSDLISLFRDGLYRFVEIRVEDIHEHSIVHPYKIILLKLNFHSNLLRPESTKLSGS
jgi:hypothetical protein